MREPKFGDKPDAIQFTILYSDGHRETRDKGLLIWMMPDGGVEGLAMKLNSQEYLTLVAGLEAAIKDIETLEVLEE